MTSQINQLKQQQNVSTTIYNACKVANILHHIFKNIETMDKAQLKALYLTVINHIDIRKDDQNKKQFYVTLKLNHEII